MGAELPGRCKVVITHLRGPVAIARTHLAVFSLEHAGGAHPASREGHLLLHRSARIGLATFLAAAVLAPAVSAVSTTGAGATSGPLIRVRSAALHAGTASTNWSGYGIAGSFAAVTGSWTVPTVASTGGASYSSSWIGVDGMANRSLLQTGTEADYVNGVAQYDAWWEVLPAAEKVITTVPVHPGDHMSASITHGAGHKWTVVLSDVTTGRSFAYTRAYRGTGASAEWIQERPQIGSALATLAAYGSTTFTGLSVNGATPHLVPAEAISMVDNTGTHVISAPSAPSGVGDAFTVAYGASPPPAPAG